MSHLCKIRGVSWVRKGHQIEALTCCFAELNTNPNASLGNSYIYTCDCQYNAGKLAEVSRTGLQGFGLKPASRRNHQGWQVRVLTQTCQLENHQGWQCEFKPWKSSES